MENEYFKKFLILFYFIIFIIDLPFKKKGFKSVKKTKIYLDKYETKIYYNIKEKLLKNKCSQMWNNQKEFLNGVIRKFKPKKILEIGVAQGGSSIIILNAIKDIKNSHLYSVDLSSNSQIGYCVRNLMKKYINKWSLYTGNIVAKFIEEIGNNLDMVFIDSAHYEPGEILDFLIVLPFLNEGAIVAFHDIGNQITNSGKKNTRKEWAPYIIFNIIKGKKYLPSGNKILTQDIGAIKLEENQIKYIHDYCRTLGGQWQYFPKEIHIELVRKIFSKYYDNECLFIFEESVAFNRNFVKNNPIKNLYINNSDPY
jgi:predicted O-methyltransferase YrrM